MSMNGTGNDEETLLKENIRPTAVRLLVWRAVKQFSYAFSLADLEEKLPTVDRSSIFRVLTLLSDHHILHEVDDGSGFKKYCVCHCENHSHCASGECGCAHVHLSCVKCHKTFCLNELHIPYVPIPDDFIVLEREYVVKGICPECQKKSVYSQK